jgi:hypothetical protein
MAMGDHRSHGSNSRVCSSPDEQSLGRLCPLAGTVGLTGDSSILKGRKVAGDEYYVHKLDQDSRILPLRCITL